MDAARCLPYVHGLPFILTHRTSGVNIHEPNHEPLPPGGPVACQATSMQTKSLGRVFFPKPGREKALRPVPASPGISSYLVTLSCCWESSNFFKDVAKPLCWFWISLMRSMAKSLCVCPDHSRPLQVHSPPARKQGRGRQERAKAQESPLGGAGRGRPPGLLHLPESNAANKTGSWGAGGALAAWDW